MNCLWKKAQLWVNIYNDLNNFKWFVKKKKKKEKKKRKKKKKESKEKASTRKLNISVSLNWENWKDIYSGTKILNSEVVVVVERFFFFTLILYINLPDIVNESQHK